MSTRTALSAPACSRWVVVRAVRSIRAVPIDGASQTIFERNFRAPSEECFCATRIKATTRLSIWLRGIPANLAIEVAQLRDQLHEIANGDFHASAEIDRCGVVHLLRSADDARSAIVDEEKLARNDRWQRILIEACKRSRRAWLPELVAGGSIAEVMQREAIRQAASFIAHLAPTSRPLDVALRESASHASAIVWIGPEGGFTDAEVSLLQASGGYVVTLGAHVLRIETAAVAAAAVFAQSRLAVNEG